MIKRQPKITQEQINWLQDEINQLFQVYFEKYKGN